MKRRKSECDETHSNDEKKTDDEPENQERQQRKFSAKRRRTSSMILGMPSSAPFFAGSSSNKNSNSNSNNSSSATSDTQQEQEQLHQSSNTAHAFAATAQSSSKSSSSTINRNSSNNNKIPHAGFGGASSGATTATTTAALAPTIQTSNIKSKKSKTTPVNAAGSTPFSVTGSAPLFSTASSNRSSKPPPPPPPPVFPTDSTTAALFNSPPQAQTNNDTHSLNSAPTIQLRKKTATAPGSAPAPTIQTTPFNAGSAPFFSAGGSTASEDINPFFLAGGGAASEDTKLPPQLPTTTTTTPPPSPPVFPAKTTTAALFSSPQAQAQAQPSSDIHSLAWAPTIPSTTLSSASVHAAPDSITSNSRPRPPRPHAGLSSQTKKLPLAQSDSQRVLFEATQSSSPVATQTSMPVATVRSTPPRSRPSAFSALSPGTTEQQGGYELTTLAPFLEDRFSEKTNQSGTPGSASDTPRRSKIVDPNLFEKIYKFKHDQEEKNINHEESQHIEDASIRLSHYKLSPFSEFGIIFVGRSKLGNDFLFPWNQLGLTYFCDLLAPLIIDAHEKKKSPLRVDEFAKLIGQIGAYTNQSFLKSERYFLEILDKSARACVVKTVAQFIATSLETGELAPSTFEVVGEKYGPRVKAHLTANDQDFECTVQTVTKKFLLADAIKNTVEDGTFDKAIIQGFVRDCINDSAVPSSSKSEFFSNVEATVELVQKTAMEQLAKMVAPVFILGKQANHKLTIASFLHEACHEESTMRLGEREEHRFLSVLEEQVAILDVVGGPEHCRFLVYQQQRNAGTNQQKCKGPEHSFSQALLTLGDRFNGALKQQTKEFASVLQKKEEQETLRLEQWKEANVEISKTLQKSEEEQTKRVEQQTAQLKCSEEEQTKRAEQQTAQLKHSEEQQTLRQNSLVEKLLASKQQQQQQQMPQQTSEQLQQILQRFLPQQPPPSSNDTSTSQPSVLGQQQQQQWQQPLFSTTRNPTTAFSPNTSTLQQWQQPSTMASTSTSTAPFNFFAQALNSGSNNPFASAPTQPAVASSTTDSGEDVSMADVDSSQNGSSAAAYGAQSMFSFSGLQSTAPAFNFSQTGSLAASTAPAPSSAGGTLSSNFGSALSGSAGTLSSGNSFGNGSAGSTTPGFRFPPTGAPTITSAGGTFASAIHAGTAAATGSVANPHGGGSVPAAGWTAATMGSSISQTDPALSRGAPPSADSFDPHAGAFYDEDL